MRFERSSLSSASSSSAALLVELVGIGGGAADRKKTGGFRFGGADFIVLGADFTARRRGMLLLGAKAGGCIFGALNEGCIFGALNEGGPLGALKGGAFFRGFFFRKEFGGDLDLLNTGGIFFGDFFFGSGFVDDLVNGAFIFPNIPFFDEIFPSGGGLVKVAGFLGLLGGGFFLTNGGGIGVFLTGLGGCLNGGVVAVLFFIIGLHRMHRGSTPVQHDEQTLI